ncbi:Undecaprenyl-phosphate galactose phosphotransferase, WbaP/exopolysaccharide biosynthesis polyprenyl glycosylphosphotransferase [Klenkia soli]|uniref:Undecaprenyl-phosphate galactose phosphotransferase, WbaP/exopolysaccharide biosynthesis polyprenyl glycosylphosphotransferase n=1 Tax=Klenkia soli TaxID=1052260 RepID=A0A1H0J3X1_9ACTN|nr:sugar transferase [Klenkia soli]SDO38149.1 Undecaprenyl-phosphate galactose phosphotransferase, WbaP/exopolysaccharide biosynthesis polyprenyl glycosylphosphotransferase [Klenkia soli]
MVTQSDALVRSAREAKAAEVAAAAELAAEAAVSGLDEDSVVGPGSVRPLRTIRPVPPVRSPRTARAAPVPDAAPATAVPPAALDLPRYDPLTARRRPTPEWLVQHTTLLVAGDLAAGLGSAAAVVAVDGGVRWPVLVGLAWPLVVALCGGYAERRAGSGSAEFQRVALAGLATVAVLAVLQALQPTPVVGWAVLVGVPAVVAWTVLARGWARRRLHARRRAGAMAKRVVLVGRQVAVADLARRLARDPASGLRVIGACVPRPGGSGGEVAPGVPVLGGLDDAVAVLENVRADAVVVASASETAAEYLRELTWRLEGTNVELLVAPGLIEVAPARLHVRPTSSVPLLHVREPEFRGRRRLAKATFDRAAAGLALLVGGPVLLLLALAVKVDSRGPVFYRHRRIGRRGEPFELLKFRSMAVGADAGISALAGQNQGNEVQFKLHRDPRVTRVGALIRRLSLDELPQLINVLRGEMSIVGPRPHVTREVDQYGADMHRRLLVKPGMTGLWQVSGRSDLDWDESVELDVRYVENWSLSLDLAILRRTFSAVVSGSGAY